MTSDHWVEEILAVKMPAQIPIEVRNLFDVARGTLCYGWFFYPLYTLRSEESFRVLEAPLKHRCQELGAPRGASKGFSTMVDWLASRDVISKEERVRWEAAKHLQNSSSHPERQSINSSVSAVNGLQIAVEMTVSLFGAVDSS
jgi:hypothetical protein